MVPFGLGFQHKLRQTTTVTQEHPATLSSFPGTSGIWGRVCSWPQPPKVFFFIWGKPPKWAFNFFLKLEIRFFFLNHPEWFRFFLEWITLKTYLLTSSPWKTNMEANHGPLEEGSKPFSQPSIFGFRVVFCNISLSLETDLKNVGDLHVTCDIPSIFAGGVPSCFYLDSVVQSTRWWQLKHFFLTLFLEDSHFDEHIFQMGWFNHQHSSWK